MNNILLLNSKYATITVTLDKWFVYFAAIVLWQIFKLVFEHFLVSEVKFANHHVTIITLFSMVK